MNISSNTIQWQGFHHVAVVTCDLDATVQFYGDLLGMQVGEIMPATPQRGRHCFIRPGDTDALGLHFFEHPTATIFPFEDGPDPNQFIAGAVQHLAFTLPSEAVANQLRERLLSHNISVTPINQIGPWRNFLFSDNNGILLEAIWR